MKLADVDDNNDFDVASAVALYLCVFHSFLILVCSNCM